nr:hypothetical protein [Kineosporia sp. NBRC 101677]
MGDGDVLRLLRVALATAQVRVQFAHAPAVGLVDLLPPSRLEHTQHLVGATAVELVEAG